MTRFALLAVAIVSIATVSPSAQDQPRPASAAPTQVVNLNSATVPQLEALPGIGRATAERIVEYRQKNGGFKRVEDLMNVRGVGEKSFLKLKPLITVAAPRADRSTP